MGRLARLDLVIKRGRDFLHGRHHIGEGRHEAVADVEDRLLRHGHGRRAVHGAAHVVRIDIFIGHGLCGGNAGLAAVEARPQQRLHLHAAGGACEEMAEAIQFAHKRGVSVYVAINGPIMEALKVGIKKTPDESMDQVANAIMYLGINDVIAEAESEILLRVLNNEKSLRKNKNVRKLTPRMRLSKAMYEKARVDLLVDGYNFMHGSAELFNKYLKFTKKRDKTYFTEDGKNHLAKLLSVFRAQNHLVNVHLFFDGNDVEEGSPHPGVEIHKPSIVKEGTDQADAEIIEYLFKKSRKDALVFAVTNDKAIQRVAAIPMAIDIFREYLLKINTKN